MNEGTVMRAWATATVIVLLVAAPLGGISVATGNQTTELTTFDSLRIHVQSEGMARTTAISTYNLSDPTENQTFSRLQTNLTARQEAVEQFRTRFRAYVNATAELTDREMMAANESITLSGSNNGSTGIVIYRATWRNLSSPAVDRIELAPTDEFAPVGELIVERPSTRAFDAVDPAPEGTIDGSLAKSQTVTFVSQHRTKRVIVEFRSRSTSNGTPLSTQTSQNTQSTEGLGSGFGIVQAVIALVYFVGLGAIWNWWRI